MYANNMLLQVRSLNRLLTTAVHTGGNPDIARTAVQKKEIKTSSAKSALMAYNELDQSFTNAEIAYRSKTTPELLRSIFVFRLCTFSFLVNKNKELMNLSRKILGRKLFHKLMRSTFYGQFVAGEDQEEIRDVIAVNRLFGVKSILDYSVEEDVSKEEAEAKVKDSLEQVVNEPEHRPDAANVKYQTSIQFADRSQSVTSARTYFYEGEENCDRHMKIFLECIDAVSGSTNGEGFAAIKLTALGRPHLLLQMSDVLTQMRRFFKVLAGGNEEVPASMMKLDMDSFRKRLNEFGVEISYDEQRDWFTLLDVSGDGEIDLLDWTRLKNFENNLANIFRVRNKQTGEYEQLVPTLTEEGIAEMRNMLHRVDTIASYAREKDVRVMVDAEQTYLQPAISRIVMEAMRRFNKEKSIIFNTYQCYLKDAVEHLSTDLQLAEREDFYFGAKLVRGAYMEQERERAKTLGYEDPINPTFEATTAMYEAAVDETFRNIKRRPKGKIAVMIASHNEDSVRSTIAKMKHYNVHPEDRLICFGQLLGMCDQISFSLGQAGYSVYKYVPYGPIDDVLPYLSRRAMENKGVLAKVKKERQMLWTELKRRIACGEMRHDPINAHRMMLAEYEAKASSKV